MFEMLWEGFKRLIRSRLFLLSLVLVILFAILVEHLFQLQIIQGEAYADSYTLTIEKEVTTTGSRGCIYDCNGILLAYNELSYSITLEDSGYYSGTTAKNLALNAEIYEIVSLIEANGDTISNSFSITLDEDGTFQFTVSGTTLQRFRADVYGYSSISDLTKNSNKLGYEESEATAEQVVAFLCSSSNYGIHIAGIDTPTEEDIANEVPYYSVEDAYKILVIRYALSQNYYQRYVATTIATGVSDETVAAISENAEHLEGVAVAEDTIRVYPYAEYFSHIIGYTGKISTDEYEELSEENSDYTLTDIVGKSGIEKEMEVYLQGTKGYEKFYVDNLGRVTEVVESVSATAGEDIYLSIDAELQKDVYDLLEQEIAGIVYSKIVKSASSSSSSSDIVIPIKDVYFALINNNVIDIDALSATTAGTAEAEVYAIFSDKLTTTLAELKAQLVSSSPTKYSSLSDEAKEYQSYVLTLLSDDSIYDTSAVDTSDATYSSWKNGKISLAEYLQYAISQNWIDITGFEVTSTYSDSDEVYEALVSYIIGELEYDKSFHKEIYEYLIENSKVTGKQICMILFEQGILEEDETSYTKLQKGSLDPYTFLKEKIKNLEITPAQLALDPCTGSCVIINPQTGELLACVSYPGYDTNRLANTMDVSYYYSLQEDLTSPFYNNATQQTTAPGSTFKMVTATAALTEGLISTSTKIYDNGIFELVENGPKCWKYPGTHGSINVAEALRDSCNYFFYTLGYNLSLNGSTYVESQGIETLQYYAALYGLNQKTGIEIAESTSKVADEYPITAAIGQSNNSITTIALARYVAAIASSGDVYQLTLLDKRTDSEGTILEDYSPTLLYTMDEISTSTWSAIHKGMLMVVENSTAFNGFSDTIQVAGKTGTAQQVSTRPNHALFIGYAPYDEPEIAIATRIAYGYSSKNAAQVSRYILEYYFGLVEEEELLDGQATDVNATNSFTD